jgi:predicted ABC-type ATPase
MASIRAARLLLARWRELVAARQSFGFESTLSGRTYARMLSEARAAGYRVQISYLALPAIQYSIRRVRERVRKGGHDVPLADLRRRFLPSLANFFHLYLPLTDSATLHDAGLNPTRLVASWRGADLTVIDDPSYERIRKLVS